MFNFSNDKVVEKSNQNTYGKFLWHTRQKDAFCLIYFPPF